MNLFRPFEMLRGILPAIEGWAAGKRRVQSAAAARQREASAHEQLELQVKERTEALQTEVLERSRAEESLRKNQEMLRAVIEGTSDAIAVKDLQGRYLLFNRAAARLAGVDAGKVLGCDDSCLLPPEEAKKVIDSDRALMAAGQVTNYEESLTDRAGRRRIFLSTKGPLIDSNKKVAGLFSIARDITGLSTAADALHKSNQRLELLAWTESELLRSDSPKEVVDSLCRKVMAFLGCDLFFNFLEDDQRQRLHLNACAGISKTQAQNIEWIDHGSALCGCTVDDGQVIIAENIAGRTDSQTELLKAFGIQAYCSHPLISGGRLLGTLAFGTHSRIGFLHNELALMKAVADHLALAMGRNQAQQALQKLNSVLEQRVQERTAQWSQANQALQSEILQRQRVEQSHLKVARQLSEAQETERSRFSRELHDQLGQELTALKLGLRLITQDGPHSATTKNSLAQLEDLADSLMKSIHHLAWELRPIALDDFGLEEVLPRYVNQWSEKSGVPVDFHSQGMDAPRLPAELETALYRVTQEALTNIARHAKAQRVSVLIDRRVNLVSLIIEDDGAGFDVDAIGHKPGPEGHMGLVGIQERVMLAGGNLEIESAIGKGTTVFVRLPLSADE